MEKHSDEYIMNRIIKGNLNNLTYLFDRYNNQILNYFYRMTGNIDDSKDLTQNVFFRILKYKHAFKKSMVFKYWMFKIAKNILSDYYSSEQKKIKYTSYVNDENNSTYDPNKDLLLYEAISKLPIEYKELIILNKFTNLKNVEIAEIYRTTEASIKNKLYRALNKLREIYFENN